MKLKKIFSLFFLTVCVVLSFTSMAMAQALTVDGNANVLDSTDDEGKQFLTVQSRDGNIYYIIIDNQKDENNVYFLNAVDDIDILSFATDSTGNNYHLTGTEIVSETTEETTETTTIETTTESTTSLISDDSVEDKSRSIGLLSIVGVLLIGGVIVAYFVFKNKMNDKFNSGKDEEDNEEYDENDDDEQEYSDFIEEDTSNEEINDNGSDTDYTIKNNDTSDDK